MRKLHFWGTLVDKADLSKKVKADRHQNLEKASEKLEWLVR
jgi:hypothetical protein